MDAIKVKDVNFSYDGETPVLNNLSFTIPKGKYTTIIGHNGSGKSTVAKMLIGLLEAKDGSIEILDQPLSEENLSAIREKVGIVFQNPDNQFIGSTVADDIAFGLENMCVPTEDMQQIIEESAAKVGMSKYLDAEPTNLSGGQKQRVAIAGVLAASPEILIFDEATSMLDPQGKKQINDQIEKLARENNLTILSITHNMDEVAQSDHVIVLENGKAVMEGSPHEIFEHEDLLRRMKLDVPYALKVSNKLKEMNLIDESFLDLNALGEKLWQLKSTK